MDQTICSSSRPREEPDVCHDNTHRNDERRAAIEQMMAANREGLGMKVIAVIVQRYGVLPKEMWDLNSISDMGAGRGITYDGYNVSKAMFESIISKSRYSIVNLTINRSDDEVDLPITLRELEFHWHCNLSTPLELPANLRKLKLLSDTYNLPIVLPPGLIELEIGSAYNCPLALPQRLERLFLPRDGAFNCPLALPPSLKELTLSHSYNHPLLLPSGIKEVRVGSAFTHNLLFPDSLRKIQWCCNRPIQIPDGMIDMEFWELFDQPVLLPPGLKAVTFYGHAYSHPIQFPAGLEDLTWCPSECDSLVLPAHLWRLTWGSYGSVRLPNGLEELLFERDAPLNLPEGLLKVSFSESVIHGPYILPKSVREVTWSNQSNLRVFTHPSTLEHLILEYSYSELDLSHNAVRKLTIRDNTIKIKEWPPGLEELEFTVDNMHYPLRVPEGCRIVGEKRPTNVIME